MCMTSNGEFLYTGGYDMYVKRWSVKEKKRCMDYGECHDEPVMSVVLSKNEEELYTFSRDGVMKTWKSMRYCPLKNNFKKEQVKGFWIGMFLDECGKNLYLGNEEGNIIVWNLEENKKVSEFGDQKGIKCLNVSKFLSI